MKDGLIPGTKLGLVVKDMITGFEGLAVARTEFMNGCVRYSIQPMNLGEDGLPAKAEGFDEQQLIVGRKAAPKGLVMPKEPTIKMLSIVRDHITTFEGVVTARVTLVDGAPEVHVEPNRLNKNGGTIEGRWFSQERLIVLTVPYEPEPDKEPGAETKPARVGGPQRAEYNLDAPRH